MHQFRHSREGDVERSKIALEYREHGRLRREFIIGSIAINQSRHRIEARDPAYGARHLDCVTRTHGGKKDL